MEFRRDKEKAMKALIRRINNLILLFLMAVWATCGMSYADSIIGSPGAGFQNWDVSFSQLNTNRAPYWDYPTQYDTSNIPGFPPFSTFPRGEYANVGFCLTGTINCPERFLKPGPAPGSLPFWGMSYDSAADTGGALDPNFFFKREAPNMLRATLELQLSTLANEINEFGWFETNSSGSTIGPMHQLFAGSPDPSPLGISVAFNPTQYYGYYFRDISENCLVATLLIHNICTDLRPDLIVFQHSLAAFATDLTNPTSPLSSFWIAGLNAPGECRGADCNLTLVEVAEMVPEPATLILFTTGLVGLFVSQNTRFSGAW
jgi:hypothetical protein